MDYTAVKVTIILDQEQLPETEEILRAILKDALCIYTSYSDDRVFIEPVNFETLEI